jgi:hypothetical protein
MFKHIQLVAFALCALLVIPAAAQVPGYVPTDGLVGWWPFNGNANDESGNGNDGTVYGATLTEDRFGNAGSAFSFDGVDDFINVLNNDELSLTSDEFSISAWYATAPSIIADNRNILCKSNGPGAQNKWILMKSEGGGFYPEGVGLLTSPIINAAAFNGFTSVTDPSEYNNWNHILITKINDSINLYLNGEISSVASITSNISPSVADLRIGGDEINSVDNAKFWSGLLDDIAIYNRALTEQEIQNLHTSTTPAPCAALPTNLQEGLVGYWPFCGNANDESGNGNDGTVNGATLTEDRFGNAESSFSFNGIDQYLNLGSFNPFISSGSINVWINESNGTEGLNYIISKFDGSSPPWPDNSISRSWMLYRHNPQYGSLMTFQLSQDGEYAVNVFSDFQGVSGTWTCLTVTFELGVIKFYKNGILMSQSSAPMTSVYSSETPVLVGISAQGSGPEAAGVGGYFDGLIDDIGIWNRALTPEEVQELYTLDACTFTVYDTSYVTVYDTLTTYETVYDTLYTYETIYDTVTTFVTVTDTLLIDITFTGIEGQPSWLNTVTVFPNPASDHITIDYGNFALLAGYNTIITDAAGATVYSSAVNSQQAYIDINAWGAAGVYYLTIYDAGGAPVAVRHIVLE